MTEYTLTAESSIPVAITGAEVMGVVQNNAYKQAKLSDFLAFASTANPVVNGNVTFSGTATFNNGVNFASQVNIVASGQSVLLGTTLTMKVGFFGAAGTSQRTGAAQATLTLSTFTAATCGTVGFTSTAQASLLFGQIQEVQQTLLDLGVWKGS